MKKRLPIFSVLLFIAAAGELSNLVNRIQQMFAFGVSGIGNIGSMVKGYFSDFLTVGLLVALGVIAILITSKPNLAKPAGFIALAWGALEALSLITGLGSMFSYGLDGQTVVINLVSRIPTVIVLIYWLMPAVNMVSDKPIKKAGPAFVSSVCIAMVIILAYGVRVILGGNSNVVAVLANAALSAIPSLALYFAATMLHTAIADPENAPLVTREKVKTILVGVITIAIILGLSYSCSSSGGQRGDGISTCRNCGREVPLVAGFGYCSTCYDGFIDWQNRTWED